MMDDKRRVLVAYFSCTGTTAALARRIAEAAGASLYEIAPETPYTKADLDWTDKRSRSTLEMNDPACRPALAGAPPEPDSFNTLLVGFPIWWYTAPSAVHSFLDSCELAGKTVVPFATSGSSGFGDTDADIRKSCPASADCRPGRVLNRPSDAELADWLRGLDII